MFSIIPSILAAMVLAIGVLLPAQSFAQGLEFGPQNTTPSSSQKAPPASKKQLKPAVAKPTLAAPVATTAATAPVAAVPMPSTSAKNDGGSVPALTPGPAAPAPPAPEKAATLVIPQTRGDAATTSLPPKPAPANCRNESNFESWLATFRKEAAAEGLSKAAIAEVLDGMTMDPSVIARDRRQGVFMLSFLEFSAKLATPGRVTAGKSVIAKNKATFDRVAKEYGVPASVITGFWALESDFGTGMGNLPILRSIATLAYDCRRGPMFRDELKAVIKIVERGDMRPSEMIGSWAGEIGQTQFLPTRYLEYAVDYDGDGKANLFRDQTDIIGSTAHYMHQLGWLPDQPWLEEVKLAGNLPWDQADLAIQHPRSKWAEWGVTRASGEALPADQLPATLMLPMGRRGTAFLAYPNFHIYLKWNQSLNYAVTAAYLATRIDGAAPLQRGPADIPVLSAEDAKELQRQLKKRGFDVGEVDGRIGSSTRAAVKQMQIKLKMPADSYPTPELLAALRNG